MFRKMRKKEKQLSEVEIKDVLEKCEFLTLATYGEDGWPYAVPLSYVVIEDKVYFHCSTEGQKYDCIENNLRVCLSAVRDVEAVWDNDFSTYFQSVTLFGTAKILDEGAMKRSALLELAHKYLPEHMDKAQRIIDQYNDVTAVVEITPVHMTGKAKRRK